MMKICTKQYLKEKFFLMTRGYVSGHGQLVILTPLFVIWDQNQSGLETRNRLIRLVILSGEVITQGVCESILRLVEMKCRNQA